MTGVQTCALPIYRVGLAQPVLEVARQRAAAARDAARAAARDALKPTVDELQRSALDLLDRMIAVTENDVAA